MSISIKPNSQEVTATWILQRITQEKIFEKYLGTQIILDTNFSSPFRKDENPSCTFHYYGYKLRFRDWAEAGSLTTMDCFDIVARVKGCSFREALKVIAYDFDLTTVEPKYKSYKEDVLLKHQVNIRKTKSKTSIRIRAQKLTETDLAYLNSYGITSHVCKEHNVYSVGKLWLNGMFIYNYDPKDPALGYYLGRDSNGFEHWKIYFYKRTKKGKERTTRRFITNTSNLQGFRALIETGENLIITKSMKDVLVLTEIGIPAISLQSEGEMPSSLLIDSLKSRFDNIYLFYDFDLAGVSATNKIRKMFGLKYMFLTRKYHAKDISDFSRRYGLETAKDLVSSFIYADRSRTA